MDNKEDILDALEGNADTPTTYRN